MHDPVSPAVSAGTPAAPLVVLERMAGLDGADPADVAEAVRDLPGLVLLESARPGRRGRWSFLTADPLAVDEEPSPGPDPFAGARALLRRLAAEPVTPGAGEGPAPPFTGGLAGYLSYDLGRRLERLPALAVADQLLPELRLALHDWVVAWERSTGRAWLAGRAADRDRARLDARLGQVRARLARVTRSTGRAVDASRGREPDRGPDRGPVRLPVAGGGISSLLFVEETDRGKWVATVEAVRTEIARGELYQANVARRLVTAFAGDPWPRFLALRSGEPALFSAYLDLGPDPATGAARALLSASPEPFLRVAPGGVVATDPIKGTRPRGSTRAEERALARELMASAKDRAENTMIVDVLRNDLGRVCRPGSVRVPRLWRLERTPMVQHLVSTVTGVLAAGRDAFDLLAAAFPGGSITGAPKIRAMELIEALEPVRRGPYTGAALWLGPDGAMGSSILIRTFVADGRRLTLHVGGGITWRSDPYAEWEETVAKARGPLRAIGAVVRS